MKGIALKLCLLLLIPALALASACGDDDDDNGETAEPPAARTMDAPVAAITVDGDASDWADVDGLDASLEPIQGQDDAGLESKDATVKIARDDEYVYALLEVTDDYNWNKDDDHLSGAAALLWNADADAGAHMGAEDAAGAPSTGLVDLWHWELACAAGEPSGGSVSGPGAGNDPGNDENCNLDDEWARSAAEREDDNGDGAENSLLGVWSHTDQTADAEGTWFFEMRRPLQTGDEQDAQFAAGETALLAIAYWDADNSPEGWSGAQHVQSSNEGWIEVNLAS